MNWIDRSKLANHELLAGTFLNLGSANSTEIAGQLGYDWLLLDLEHGSGSWADLRGQLQALHGSESVAIVRVRSTNADAVKFVLDSGAAGIMFPYISSVAEAQLAVAAVKYPPQGQRGVAQTIRATDYGRNWQEYLQTANQSTMVIVQIETPEAAAAADEIAAVEGVDALFIGPMDLSVNLGCPGEFHGDVFQSLLAGVVAACRRHGKTAGILSRPELLDTHFQQGFRLIALGSDTGSIVSGLSAGLRQLRACRNQS